MSKIITAIIIIFSVAVWTIFVIWPKYQELKPLKDEVAVLDSELQKQQDFYGELAGISEKLKGYPEALAKIDSGLPSDVSMPSILDYLQKKASESGLILMQFGSAEISSSAENPRIKDYTLAVSLSGSYTALKDFLKIMESSARIIEVDNISFTSGAQANSAVSFSLSLKFHSY